MMRGMTGFAEKSYAARSLRVKISIKTLNHRFFDWSYRGTPIGETETKLRGLCQKYIRRGRVEVFLDITSVDPESWEFSINEGLLEKIHTALGRVSRRTGHRLEFPAESLFRIPHLVEVVRKKWTDQEIRFLIRSFEKTLARVVRLRQREGRETASQLRTHIRAIRSSALRIEQRFRKQPARIENKLKQRIRDLNRSPFLTEERLAEEAAYLTQRYDLAEEIGRLKTHLASLESLISFKVTGPVGKKMDFLAQELHREANTMNSKSQDIQITKESLAIKNEVESIRQHVQNVE